VPKCRTIIILKYLLQFHFCKLVSRYILVCFKICLNLFFGSLDLFFYLDDLSAFSADATSQLDVLWHDCDALGVDGAQVCVFEEANEIRFGCFLQCHDGRRLETQVSLEVLGDLTNQALEWQLTDEQLS
jgi:hypothetical protein